MYPAYPQTMASPKRQGMPSMILAVAGTTSGLSISYSAFRFFMSPTAKLNTDEIFLVAKMAPLLGTTRLFLQAFSQDLPDDEFGIFCAFWAQFMYSALYLSGRPNGLHTGYAHLASANTLICSVGLLAAIEKRWREIWSKPEPEPESECEYRDAEKCEEDFEEAIPTTTISTVPKKAGDAVRAILIIFAAWAAYRFIRLEISLIPQGWSTIEDLGVLDTFISSIRGTLVTDLALMAVLFVLTAVPLTVAIKDRTVSLFDVSGYALVGRVVLLLRQLFEMIYIGLTACVIVTGTTIVAPMDFMKIAFSLLGGWALCGVLAIAYGKRPIPRRIII
ncbi:unnamed protein product [Clonostachys chloroleuca]|uniref:Uncharacterized protein n=1 Tax=Clonostachys chloroleuca TaxID=1926264 RepID=A0AA35Q1F4_9HYPO|nr:unnamed protein product [Clonostachys chloroleuca]